MYDWDREIHNVLDQNLLANIAEEKNWVGLRGLKKFEMQFSDVNGWHIFDQAPELVNLVRSIVCRKE